MKIRKAVSRETEAGRQRLGEHPDLEVDAVDVAVVDVADLLGELRVVGQVLEAA